LNVKTEGNRKSLSALRLSVAMGFALGLGLLLMLGLASRRARMPSYAGRSAEDWLNENFDWSNHTTHDATVPAFRQMGTNGIAFLVETLGRRERAFSRLYRRMFVKLPTKLRTRLPRPVYPEALVFGAFMTLEQLSLDQGDPAPERTFPHLVKLLEVADSRRRQSSAAVVSRYASMYPQLDLAPFRSELVRALNDENVEVRLFIAGPSPVANLVGPEELARALKPALTNFNSRVRRVAQEHLKRAGLTNLVVEQINGP